jgi:hypothetical protein
MIPPPVAVTVRAKVPGAAVEPADKVNVRLPVPGATTLDEESAAVTPLGTPLTASAIGALKPDPAAVVTVIGSDPPRANRPLAAPRANVNVPLTDRLRV